MPFRLEIDCFASRLNYKLKRYFSHYPDPLSSGVDAFSVRWVDGVYLFPPFPLINRVISKFTTDQTDHGVIILPYWPSQAWFPSLLSILISAPFLIPSDSVLDESCRMPRNCRLVAWIIGCNHAERMAYRMRLQFAASEVLSARPLSRTKGVGPGLVIGTINGKVITVVSL